MNGRGLICLRLANHRFFEHASFVEARAEANRLAETLGSAVVVYVPVLRVEPPRRTNETPVVLSPDVLSFVNDESLPF